jgi:aryl-alcohol dehydrogenase-like predicted oxidoreductase
MFQPRVLGRTGLRVGPLGISASYGVPASAVERAVDAGMNYLYWGSARRRAFADALRHLAPRRDNLVLAIQSYARLGRSVTGSVERGLRTLGFDRADVLLLGWWNHRPPSRIIEACEQLKARGLVGRIAMSTHNRPLVAEMARDPVVDIFHVRYNAAHRGAETDVFPHVAGPDGPGLVSYTATSWRQLLDARRVPAGERVPTAADCYRFVLSQPAVHVCMTGPSSAEHVDMALEAVRLGPMTGEELEWMRRVGDAVRRKNQKP